MSNIIRKCYHFISVSQSTLRFECNSDLLIEVAKRENWSQNVACVVLDIFTSQMSIAECVSDLKKWLVLNSDAVMTKLLICT